MKATKEEIELTAELVNKISNIVFEGYAENVQYSALATIVSTFCVVVGKDREEADDVAAQFFDQLKHLIDREDANGIFHIKGRFK